MEGSILGSNFAGGKKRAAYTRAEAELGLKAAQEGKSIPEIHAALTKAGVSPKERSLNSVQYLVRTVLAPMTSMDQFNKRFPANGESTVEEGEE